ncbi:CaiB/BaiF CoA transferase family protein [Corynebacterium sp. A21]|uniref:CaiB/BaiF CoA transferase family protein n=1 Tax=Corynebacterium sp. A21 TaxID=3457318 RepID=UPI003FD0AF0E
MTESPTTPVTPSNGPLNGIRILDFTQFLSGPYGTQLLGDMGAEIIKVEAPAGDLSRTVPPHFIRGDSAYFHTINRNKQSIVIDLKAPGASDIVRDLIDNCDVIVENFRPGVLSRLGIDRDEELKRTPSLIWSSISGFGQTGPDRDLPAYDMIVQALSGSMSLTGERGGSPVRTGLPVGDLAAGLHAAIGILAALHNLKETGQGEFIDISMLDCLVAMLSYQGTYYLESGEVPGRQGSGHDAIPTYRQFTAQDGRDIVTTANTERMWRAMAEVLGHAELVEDPRFLRNSDRLRNKEALWAIIEPAFLAKPAQEWVALFNQAGIPVGMVNDLDLALSNPQVLHRNMVVELEGENGATVKTLGNPIKLSRSPRTADTFPPTLGEHTGEILRDVLQKSSAEIDELIASGIVQSSPLKEPDLSR